MRQLCVGAVGGRRQGARNVIRVHQLLAGISDMMRKDTHLRKRWASGVLRRVSQMIRQSGLTVRCVERRSSLLRFNPSLHPCGLIPVFIPAV